MTDTEMQLRYLLDRAEIERLLIRYCNATDAGDWDAVADCFAEDGGWAHRPGEGREQLRETFKQMFTRRSAATPSPPTTSPKPATRLAPIDRVEKEQHVLSNIEVDIADDTASSFCAARVYIVGGRGEDAVLLMRGITYTDQLVRTPEGWKIKERAHHLVWMAETTPIEGAQVG